jgi:hypothetical protein
MSIESVKHTDGSSNWVAQFHARQQKPDEIAEGY